MALFNDLGMEEQPIQQVERRTEELYQMVRAERGWDREVINKGKEYFRQGEGQREGQGSVTQITL